MTLKLNAQTLTTAAVLLLLLYASTALFITQQYALAMVFVVLTAAFAIIFTSKRLYTARFYYPAIGGLLLFTVFPVLYTGYVGFTNYGGSNLLSFEQVQRFYTTQVVVDKSTEQQFKLSETSDGLKLWLPDSQLLSEPFTADSTGSILQLAPSTEPTETLPIKAMVKQRKLLGTLNFETPDGVLLQSASIKTLATVVPAYRFIDETGRLEDANGQILTPDHSEGYYQTADGEHLKPGWKTWVGGRNFDRMLNSEGIREPIVEIFIWTLIFAFGSVLGCFGVGMLLALILQWPELRGKSIYRILLILPYAVPAFISILVFRGLFNQNFGEINFLLDTLFGIKPDWFTDPFLARSIVLFVNIWLGYPYMMLLAMGFLQSIPTDHYQAAAIEGAGPVRRFFSITLPQILPPFVPMLISAFAFNFNNLVLIILLTRGGPDMPGTLIPAGSTDSLASFTYRIAFSDSAQDFGLAGAISMVMFIIVAVIAYANLIAMRKMAKGTR